MNDVLDRSDFEEQIVRMIPKAENTSEQSKQCNQRYNQRYDQSDQSNQNNAINNTARVIRPKQYGQQYDQDKPGGGYIVTNTYAKARDPSEKLDAQEVDVGK